MFQPYFSFTDHEAKVLAAYGCSNTVFDVNHPIVEQVKALKEDYIIGSVGRLDKPFVIPSLEKLHNFITQHPENSFAIVLLGGSNNPNVVLQINEIFMNLSNCKLYITGFLFPLPKAIFQLIDVFFGTAGSASVARREGCISISIDAIDCQPIGILGQTTNNTLSRSSDEPPLDLCELLDDVLYKKKYKRIEAIPVPTLNYTPHFDFLSSSEQEKEYYDVFKIYSTLHCLLMKAYISIFGPYKYVEFRNK